MLVAWGMESGLRMLRWGGVVVEAGSVVLSFCMPQLRISCSSSPKGPTEYGQVDEVVIQSSARSHKARWRKEKEFAESVIETLVAY